jgi:hypothetical protein
MAMALSVACKYRGGHVFFSSLMFLRHHLWGVASGCHTLAATFVTGSFLVHGEASIPIPSHDGSGLHNWGVWHVTGWDHIPVYLFLFLLSKIPLFACLACLLAFGKAFITYKISSRVNAWV